MDGKLSAPLSVDAAAPFSPELKERKSPAGAGLGATSFESETQTGCTLVACRPLGPSVTSKLTG